MVMRCVDDYVCDVRCDGARDWCVDDSVSDDTCVRHIWMILTYLMCCCLAR